MITLDRSILAEACTWVSGAVSKNPPTPAMAGMRVQAQQGLVTLTAFDGDTMRQATIAGDDEGTLDVLVSARFLTQIVAAMKTTTIGLHLADGRLAVKAGRSAYQARVMDARDYPTLPDFPAHVGTIDADALADVLGTVEHAVAKDSPLAVLSAYNIHGDAGLFTVCATDRFRLARASSKWADASGTKFEVNVPGLALHTAVKSLRGEVQIGAAEGLFGLSDAGRVIITRVLGGEDRFPRVEPIFAAEPLLKIDVNVAELAEALKRSLLVADVTGMVTVEFSEETLTVTGDDETSSGVEEVDTAPGFGEDSMALKVNAAFLIQALAASPSPTVQIGLTAPTKPIRVTPNGIDSVTMVVMPRGRA